MIPDHSYRKSTSSSFAVGKSPSHQKTEFVRGKITEKTTARVKRETAASPELFQNPPFFKVEQSRSAVSDSHRRNPAPRALGFVRSLSFFSCCTEGVRRRMV